MDLCCPHWLTDFSRGLRNLQEQGLFCDVVIQTAECETYSAHANVLAAASPILSTYMQDSGLFVKFDEISAQTWQRLLEFMYTGKVFGVPPSDAHLLYEAARKLGIDTLTSLIDSQPDIKPHLASTEQGPPTEFVKDEDDDDDDDDDDDESEAAMEDEDNDAETSTSGNPHDSHNSQKIGSTAGCQDDGNYNVNTGKNRSVALLKVESMDMTSLELEKESSFPDLTNTNNSCTNLDTNKPPCEIETPQLLARKSKRKRRSILQPKKYVIDHSDEDEEMVVPKQFSCQDCNKAFRKKSDLSRHVLVHQERGSYPCQHCGKTFKRADTLKVHLSVKHQEGDAFCCNACGLTYGTKSSLLEHMSAKHDIGGKLHKCDRCDGSFSYRAALFKHKMGQVCEKEKETNAASSFMCHKCGSEFVKRRYLEQHLQTKHAEGQFRCEKCPKVFRNARYLRRHKLRCKGPPESVKKAPPDKKKMPQDRIGREIKYRHGKYKCDQCPQGVNSAKSLRMHKLTHLPSPPFRCKICEAQTCFMKSHFVRKHSQVPVSERKQWIEDLRVPIEQRVEVTQPKVAEVAEPTPVGIYALNYSQ